MKFLPPLRHRFKFITNDPTARWLCLSGLLLNVAQWASILILVPRRDQLVPLHYSIYFDIDLSGPWFTFLWLPLVGLAIFITNLIGSVWVEHPVWTRAWLTMTLLIESLALVAILAVWFHALRT